MNETEKNRAIIADKKVFLSKVKKKLDSLIEEIYKGFPLDEENAENDGYVYIVKNKKFILKDEFLNDEIHLRKINFTKENIQRYQEIVSDVTRHISIFEDSMN